MEEEVLKGKTILVVDDEVDLRDIMASEMEFMGGQVFQAGNISTAKDLIKVQKIDLVVSDIRMPGGTGIDLLEHLKAHNPHHPPVILITGFADISVEDAFNKGAEALLSKPFKLDDLIKVVARHTLPVEERFLDSTSHGTQDLVLEFNETLLHTMATKSFLVGRGGVSFEVGTPRRKIDIGETINFGFRFTDHVFRGTAVCRWMKAHDGGLKAGLGLEFVHLDPDTLTYFQDYWKAFPAITYIPIV